MPKLIFLDKEIQVQSLWAIHHQKAFAQQQFINFVNESMSDKSWSVVDWRIEFASNNYMPDMKNRIYLSAVIQINNNLDYPEGEGN